MPKIRILAPTLFVLVVCSAPVIRSQTTEFTYQGSLKTAGSLANGNYDFEFKLYDSASGGTQLGSTVTVSSIAVVNGVFTATLNFGDQFSGDDRFLEIGVRLAGSPDGFQQLLPRQPVTSTPYSVKSLTAANADVATTALSANNAANATTAINALQLGGIAAAQYVLTGDARLFDARNPLPGSASYIQNQNTGPQPSSNFYIGGIGRASIFNASSGFYTPAGRILASTGANSSNLFVGVNSGAFNSTGANNTFAGTSAGLNNTAGIGGSFFGFQSGLNATGSHNAFFGLSSGESTTTGERNAFYGANSGFANTTGNDNSLFGFQAGIGNTNGALNTFLGYGAGGANTLGSSNTVIGAGANVLQPDLSNATAIGAKSFVSQSNSLVLGSINGIGGASADTNVGIGTTAPNERLHVVGNGLFTGNLTVNGALAGSFSVPATNISGVLAPSNGGTGLSSAGDAGNFLRSNGSVWASSPITSADIPTNLNTYIQNQNSGPQLSSNFNISGNGTANIFDAGTQFNIGGNRILSAPIGNLIAGVNAGTALTTGTGNSFFGTQAGESNTNGTDNSFVGWHAGLLNSTGSSNAFFGQEAGANNSTGAENSFFGRLSGISNTTGVGNSHFGFSSGHNSVGTENSFVGSNTAPHNTFGSFNTFVGANAGVGNTTGNSNTAIGYDSGFTNSTFAFATAIGAGARASSSNSITLGRSKGEDTVRIPGALTFGGVLSGNGSGLTELNASNITAGILQPDRFGGYVILNTANQQPDSNFSISGSGWVGGTLFSNNLNITNNGYIAGRLGLGTILPNFKLDITDPESGGLRVQTSGTGGVGLRVETSGSDSVVASFGNKGIFQVDSIFSPAGRFRVDENGNVSIGGTIFSNPAQKFAVSGQGNVRSVINSNFPIGGNGEAGISFAQNMFENWTIATGGGSADLRILNGLFGNTVTAMSIDFATSNVMINHGIRVETDPGNGHVARFGSSGRFAIDSKTSPFPGGRLNIDENGLTTINNPPGHGLPVDGVDEMLAVNGRIRAFLPPLPVVGVPVCQFPGDSTIILCTSSIRYKKNITDFGRGLDLISRLRPVSFNWKGDDKHDFGLVAEEVAEVEPLLATYDAKGVIQGVKYDRVGVVLINAVKEQQAQITALQTLVTNQQKQIEALKILACKVNPKAAICN